MSDDAGGLEGFADGVWVSTAPVSFLGMRLTTTMTVLRLRGADLLVVSPVPLTPARRAAVEGLGRVAHLYAPNTFHHFWLGEWAAAFPEARVHAPAGLARKEPGLKIDRLHGTAPEPAFAGLIDEVAIDGFRVDETVLVHRPSRTAIVADLVHNVGRPAHGWTATYTRAMGFYDRIAVSRFIRWTGFRDRRATRRSLDDLLARDIDRLVVGHGAPIASGAKEALAAAYLWLRAPGAPATAPEHHAGAPEQ
jgi:hypothetical protein